MAFALPPHPFTTATHVKTTTTTTTTTRSCFFTVWNGAADGAVVYAGNLDSPRGQWDQQPQFTAAEIAVNPEFNNDALQNDAALLFFDDCMADGTTGIAPIQLGSSQDFRRMKSSALIVSGFGITSDDAPASVLQTASISYVAPKTCQSLLLANGAPSSFFQPDQMICTMGTQADASAPPYPPLQSICTGDSGGPLAYNRVERAMPQYGEPRDDRLLGITSWCAGVAASCLRGSAGAAGGGGCSSGSRGARPAVGLMRSPPVRSCSPVRPRRTYIDPCGQNKRPAGFQSVQYQRDWITWNLDARQLPASCAPAGTEGVATARRVTRRRNWYGAPTATVLVDKKKGYSMCQQECIARASDPFTSGGCRAFQVTVS